jgi:hypothetical protein
VREKWEARTPAGSGKSGYSFAATPGGAQATGFSFYTTGTPLANTTGTKAYCAADDGVVRTQPAGTITLVGTYDACLGGWPISSSLFVGITTAEAASPFAVFEG